jgi:Flp pilus assembly protein TadD
MMSELLSGRLRDELGLSSDVLRIGLTVARNHLLRGAQAEAMRIYVGLVLCEPMNVDFQVGLANCANLMGEQNVALQAASAVIMLAPADPRGYLLSGRSCIMMGLVDEAREDLNDALKHADGNEAVIKEAGLLLERISTLALE